ncbi:MAG TPA: zinc ABC transporter substrate-binding protein [Planctomycetes bacterium]|nr:zinc ABC transporter substrate-binding protein [Planctomycetota bacterium]
MRLATFLLAIAPLVPFAALLPLLSGCHPSGAPAPLTMEATAGPLKVATTFYPTTYFASRIGGDLIEVVCPLPRGEDPASWSPSDEALSLYQQVDLVILNGAGFEKWLATASMPLARVVDCNADLSDRWLQREETTHSHGPEGVASLEGVDGHTWLDPEMAILQSRQIHRALQRRLPTARALLAENLRLLEQDLMEIDNRLQAISAPGAAPLLLASAPVYRYLARSARWQLVSLDLDAKGSLAGTTRLAIEEALQKHPARVILWPSPPAQEMVEKLEQTHGVRSVLFSPCQGDPGPGEDYLTVMEANIDRLGRALKTDR